METPTFYLHPSDEELEEVVVSATRSTRTIQNLPTRVATNGFIFSAGVVIKPFGNHHEEH